MEIKKYVVYAWDSMEKMASFTSKEYKQKGRAEKIFNNLVNSGKYVSVGMREHKTYTDCSVEESTLIKNWDR